MYTAKELCRIYNGCQKCVKGHLYFQTLYKMARCQPIQIQIKEWAKLWGCSNPTAIKYVHMMLDRGYIASSRHNPYGIRTYSLAIFPRNQSLN